MRRDRRVLNTMMSLGKMRQGDIGIGNEHEIVNAIEIGIVIGIVIGTEKEKEKGTGTENETGIKTETGTGIETGNASVMGKGSDRRAPKSIMILRYPHAPWRTMVQSSLREPWLRAKPGSRRGPKPTAMGNPHRHHTRYAPPTLKTSTMHIRRDARNGSECVMLKKGSERHPLAVCGVSSREYLPSLVA